MKIATILPTAHLDLAINDVFHMCLAHLVRDDLTYRDWFRARSLGGDFVLMDNGVVERGTPLPMDEILKLADEVRATEIVLPDRICDSVTTLRLAETALKAAAGHGARLMAVPQGTSLNEWRECLREMLTWPIQSLGISRFTHRWSPDHRLHLLQNAPEMGEMWTSRRAIHLLGSQYGPREVREIEAELPGRVRSIDSSFPTLYAQLGWSISCGRPKPTVEFDPHARLDEALLSANVRLWRAACDGRVPWPIKPPRA